MNLRNIFLRDEGNGQCVVCCDSLDLKNYIDKWISNGSWKYNDLARFLQQAGAKFPVDLRDFNKKNCSFKCESVAGKIMDVELIFGDLIECLSGMNVTTKLNCDEEEKRVYFFNHKTDKSEMVLQKIFRFVRRDKNCLEAFYSNAVLVLILKMNNSYFIKFELDVPEVYVNQTNVVLFEKASRLEQYFLNLKPNNPLLPSIYEKVITILGFSKSDVSQCNNVVVTFGIHNKEKSKIIFFNGMMNEYMFGDGQSTYVVWSTGRWTVMSKGMSVSNTGDANLNILERNELLQNISTDDLKYRIRKKFSKIRL